MHKIGLLRNRNQLAQYLDVLNLIKIIKPKKTILTNLNNELDYNELRKKLPKFVVPAYDGMSFSI